MGTVLRIFSVICAVLYGSAPGVSSLGAERQNLAFGKPYTLSPEPNYHLASKDPDRKLLTDGIYTKGFFWTQPTTVGWEGRSLIEITIDLGSVRPIAGASFSTAASPGNVNWPRAVLVFVSDDGKDFRVAGDLVIDSIESGMPAPQGYSTHRYVSSRWQTKGRFVKLAVDQVLEYCFCDEIEVYRGEDHRVQESGGPIVPDWKSYVIEHRLDACVRKRLLADYTAVEAMVQASALSQAKKQAAQEEFKTLWTQIQNLPRVPAEGFRAILPLNDVDRRIFAWRGAALGAKGWPELVLWKGSRWDPLGPMDAPDSILSSPPKLEIRLMLNETRSDALNLTNASNRPLHVAVNLEGLPGGKNPEFVRVHHVPIVDTYTNEAVADALPQIPATPLGYVLDIPAGMNAQLWLAARPTAIPPGRYQAKLQLAVQGGATVSVPLAIEVFGLRFPDRPRLSLSGCEYSDRGLDGSEPANLRPLLEFLQARHVDSPWAHEGVLSFPGSGDFDEQDRLTRKLDFSRLDGWLSRWPDARQYFLYPARTPGSGFAGQPMGSERFERRIAAWAEAFSVHVRSRGLKASQFYLLVVDEPTEALQCQTIAAWAKAMRQVAERPRVWLTFYAAPTEPFFQQLFPLCDMLCPHVPGLIGWNEEQKASALGSIGRDRTLWLYSAIGPSRTLDPYSYYRLLPWLCFRYGAEGCLFWAFGDGGRGPTSWNDYLTQTKQYCPQYLEPDRVTDSKQMQAIIEGIQDHEYLCMLRERASALEKAGDAGKAAAARQQIERALAEVTSGLTLPGLKWSSAKDRSVAERVRLEILETLGALASP